MDKENFARLARQSLKDLEAGVGGLDKNGVLHLDDFSETISWLEYFLARQKVTFADLQMLRARYRDSSDETERTGYERAIQCHERHISRMKKIIRRLEDGHVAEVESTH